MPDVAASTLLAPWANFYVITGSSAAALTGLMFVVITLVAGEERVRRVPDGIGTFSSPTVVHFCAALFISAVLAAPWRMIFHPAILLTITGLAGVAYGLRIVVRLRWRTSRYLPDIGDWIWYAIFPLIAYVFVLGSAADLRYKPDVALFGLAAANIFLIFIGIRNAWDVVTFIAITLPNEPPTDKSL